MKYFKVTAKCGHVGKNKYYKGDFYIRAETKEEASKITRNMPRVKHDKKDAILNVEEIDHETYIKGIKENSKHPYFNCKNKQEQNRFLQEIQENIVDEENTNLEKPKKTKRHSLRRKFNNDNDYDLYKNRPDINM